MDDYLTARQRPVGITLLSILSLVGGIGMTIIIGFAAIAIARNDDRVRQASEAMAEIGIPLPLLAVGIIFLAALAWASGIGMWIGARWGWYFGSFWYAYAIVRSLSALLAVYGMSEAFSADTLSNSSRGPEYYYFKYSARLIISCLIYLYFFKANVREYFGLGGASAWKAALAEFGVCFGMVIVGSAVAFAVG